MEPSVDLKNPVNDNSANDATLPPMEVPTSSERIDKRSLRPITRPNCEHDWRDDDDEIGDMKAQVCHYCPLGRWVKK